MAITKQTIVRRRADALSAEVGNEAVLMNSEYLNYYGLDEIGSDLWRRVQTPISVEQLCILLAADYTGDREIIEKDVTDLLENLLEQKLLETVE